MEDRVTPATFLPTTFSDVAISSLGVVNSAGQITNQSNAITIRSAIIAANALGGTNTIILDNGTYQLSIAGDSNDRNFNSFDPLIGDLNVYASGLTIQGNGPGNTTIQQTTGADRILTDNSGGATGHVFTITGVTLTGGRDGASIGGGALFLGSEQGSATVTNCHFLDNQASGGSGLGGGAICHTGGDLTITNCVFGGVGGADPNTSSVSGGAISFDSSDFVNNTGATATLTITGSSFIDNSASSNSAGGGAIVISQSNSTTAIVNINTSTFTGNINTAGGGGAIAVESGSLTVTTSTFDSNQAQSAGNGGAIYAAGGTTNSVTYSRFINNSAATATNGNVLSFGAGGGSFSANDNWWGQNTGPAVNDIDASFGSAPITIANWLQLKLTASPTSINVGQTSGLTASFLADSLGNVVLPANLAALIGLPVTWTSGPLGTLSLQQLTIQATGTATATFTATGIGTANPTAQVDNPPAATTSINIVGTPPVVGTNPSNAVTLPGMAALFTAAASGTPTPTVQWQEDSGAGFANISDGTFGGVTFSGTTSGMLSVTPSSSAASGRQYRAVFTNVAGSTNSTAATMTVASSSIALSGTSLIVNDSDTITQNNLFTLSRTGTGYQIVDTSGAKFYTTIAGATGNGTNIVVVPFGTITDIQVNGNAGNDKLTVDYATGDPIPSSGLNFSGGTGVDTLAFTGSTNLTTASITHTNANDGTGLLNGKPLTYSGLDPILINTPGANWTLVYATAAAPVTLADDGSGNLLVTRTGAAEQVTISPAGLSSLTLRTGTGADTINFNSLPAGWSAGILIDGQGDSDVINFNNSAITTTGSLSLVDIETAYLNYNITAASLSGNATAVYVDDAPSGQIQDGINIAASGATIYVAAGTYTENFFINKSLTLLGAQSGVDARGRVASESILTPAVASVQTAELRTGSAGTIIDGFTFSGGTSTTNGQLTSTTGPLDNLQLLNNRFVSFTGKAVNLNDNGRNITVDKNVFDGASNTSAVSGIFHLDTDTFDGFYFTNNWVLNAANTEGFYVDGIRNVKPSIGLGGRNPLISGNKFNNNNVGMNSGSRSLTDATVSNNEFNDNIFDGWQGGPKNTLITQNTFSGNNRWGLALTSFGNSGVDRGAINNTITNNFFSNNTGLVPSGDMLMRETMAPGAAASNRIFENSFGSAVGLSYAGLSEVIQFSGNWWGTTANPVSTGHIVGAGFANVDYSPWLNSGVDTDLLTPGFQASFSTLNVDDNSAFSTLAYGPITPVAGQYITEGYDLLAGSPLRLNVYSGTYAENVNLGAGVNKAVTFAPGGSPGLVTVTSFTLTANDTYEAEVNGPVAGVGFDQLVVTTGAVDLGGATLDLLVGYVPVPADSPFLLINKLSAGAFTSNFAYTPTGSGWVTYTPPGPPDGIYRIQVPTAVPPTNLIYDLRYDGNTGNDFVMKLSPNTPPVINTSPTVFNGVYEDGDALAITLSATDLETTPGALTFAITSLPEWGTLLTTAGVPILPGQVLTGVASGLNTIYTLLYLPGGCKTSTDPSALTDAFTYSVTDTPFNGNPANTVTTGLINVNLLASTRADGLAPFLSQDPLIGTGAANNILNITGTAGNDTISVTVSGSNFVIARTGYPNTLIPTAGVEQIRIFSRGGVDNINTSTLAVNVLIVAGAGNDNVYTGTGNDIVYGGAGNDYLSGGSGADFLSGCDGADTVFGGAGNDIIAGGDGADFLYGEAGNDTFLAKETEALADRMFGAADLDTLLVSAPGPLTLNSYSLVNQQLEAINGLGNPILGTAGVDNLDFSSVVMTGVPYIDGLAGNDTITGTAGADTIYGGDGSDIINGGAGDDYLYGYGFGNLGAAGIDTIHGNAGNDTLFAGVGGSNLFGDDDNDTLYGNAGNDNLYGGNGSDTLDARLVASTGYDSLYGGAGSDNLIVGSGLTYAYGEDGTDTIHVLGDVSLDRLNGGSNVDTLILDGNITLSAFNAGNLIESITTNGFTIQGTTPYTNTLDFSSLTSVTGILRVQGGPSNNTLTASVGTDVFAILSTSTPNTIDTIYGFADTTDKLDVTTYGPLTLVKPALLPGAGVGGQINAVQYGADVYLLMPNSKRVILKNFLLTNLTGADFTGGVTP